MLPLLQAELHRRSMPHRFILTGEGPMESELRSLCPDAVFTGALGRVDVAEVFASADLFVFPSETDTAGNVVLEAQASGVPVIVSDRGGPKENVIAGISGIVCSTRDAAVWAGLMAPLLQSEDVRRRSSIEARQYALSRRWDSALAPLFDTYREMAARSARAA